MIDPIASARDQRPGSHWWTWPAVRERGRDRTFV